MGYLKKTTTRKHATTLKGRKISRKSQPSVKIDGGLSLELESWLQTDNAAALGFHSKSDFVTEAVRRYMQSIRGPRFTDLIENEEGDYTLIDTYLNLATKFLIVQVDKKHKKLQCQHCHSNLCDHVLYIWKSMGSSTRLSSLGFRCEAQSELFKYPI